MKILKTKKMRIIVMRVRLYKKLTYQEGDEKYKKRI